MSGDSSKDGTLGRIALKQVRVKRSDLDARQRKRGAASNGAKPERSAQARAAAEPPTNPLNKLVPYLDLFGRLGDDELARLAGVDVEHVSTMRVQVDEISRMMTPYEDLVDRLNEEELVRLTQATPKIVRFWLLSRPRSQSAGTSGVYAQVSAANESGTDLQADSRPASPADSGVQLRSAPPRPSDGGIDIAMEDSSPGDASGEFDPALAFEDDDDDDIDLF